MNTVNLVYFSPAGNTKKIATMMMESLQANVISYDLLQNPIKGVIQIEANTPIIFVMPVYAGRVPQICVDMIKQFHGRNTPAVAIVVYGNREYEDALLELKDSIQANGFDVVGAAAFIAQHSIFPKVAYGRPDAQDKEMIRVFAETCKAIFESKTMRKDLFVKGNSPYRELSPVALKPSANESCNACGSCAKVCPVGAIAAESPCETDNNQCISCTACITVCPQNARGFFDPMYTVAYEQFAEKYAVRKEPELFFVE